MAGSPRPVAMCVVSGVEDIVDHLNVLLATQHEYETNHQTNYWVLCPHHDDSFPRWFACNWISWSSNGARFAHTVDYTTRTLCSTHTPLRLGLSHFMD